MRRLDLTIVAVSEALYFEAGVGVGIYGEITIIDPFVSVGLGGYSSASIVFEDGDFDSKNILSRYKLHGITSGR